MQSHPHSNARGNDPAASVGDQRGTGLQSATCWLIGLPASLEAIVRQVVSDFATVKTTSASLETVLAQEDSNQVGCVLTVISSESDAAMSLPRRLHHHPSALQVIFLVAEPEVRMIGAAFRNGARDLLVWPRESDRLAHAVEQACAASAEALPQALKCLDARRKLAQLTSSECEVADRVLGGMSNKKIAMHLDMALRTVELRRKEIFDKLNTRSLAEIFSLIQEADRNFVESIDPPHHGVASPRYLRGRHPNTARDAADRRMT